MRSNRCPCAGRARSTGALTPYHAARDSHTAVAWACLAEHDGRRRDRIVLNRFVLRGITAMSLTVHHDTELDCLTLQMGENFDVSVHRDFHDACLGAKAPARSYVIDLGEVNSMDS